MIISIFGITPGFESVQIIEAVQNRKDSLEEVIQYAFDHNTQLSVMRKQVELSKSDVIRSHTLSNPEMSAVKDKNETEIEIEKEYQWGWTLGQKAAQLSHDMAKKELTIFKQSLIKDIAVSIIEIQTVQKLLDFFQNTVDLNNHFVDIAESRYKRGEISEIDLLMLKQEADSAFQEMIVMENDYQTKLIAYEMRIGYSKSDRLILPKEPVTFESKVFDSVETLSNHPQIQLLELENEKILKEISFAKSKWVPPIKVGMRYKNEGQENTYGLAFGIPFPVFDRNQANVYENEQRLEINDAQQIVVKAALLQTIQLHQLELKTTKKQIDYYQSRLFPRTEKMATLTQLAYDQGRTDIFKLLFIQKQHIEMKQKFIQLKGNQQLLLIKLQYALGNSIMDKLTTEVKK